MSGVTGVVEAASSRVGYRFAGAHPIPASAGDMSRYVERFAASGAEAVVLALNSNLAVRFATTAARLGITHRTYLYTPADLASSQIADLGDAAQHFILTSGLPPVSATQPARIGALAPACALFLKTVRRLTGHADGVWLLGSARSGSNWLVRTRRYRQGYR